MSASLSERPWSCLVVDDDAGVRQSLRLCLEAAGARVLGVGSGPAALDALTRTRFDVVFLDLWLGRVSGLDLLGDILRQQPHAGVIVVTAYASFETAVLAMKRGAANYLPKPFTPDQVRAAAASALAASGAGSSARKVVAAPSATPALQPHEADELERFGQTESPVFRDFLAAAERAAATDSTVLLRGESGTGKSTLARWMWQRSRRAGQPFMVATGADLLDPAKLAEARRGTIFIDEVAELSPEEQTRLSRFFDARGEQAPRERSPLSDVRIIAATRRALEAEVDAGRFRDDLFFRLNVVTLKVPPLRERREDIVPLAEHFLHGYGATELSAAAKQSLLEHSWPGNIRELANAIERASVLARGAVLEPVDLDLEVVESRRRASLGEMVSLADIEREHIAQVISQAPTLEAAARSLGIDPTTLQRKRKRYGLS